MNLDLWGLHLVNDLAGKSVLLDLVMRGFIGNDIVKGVIPVACLWYLWFADSHRNDRPMVISTVIVSIVAILIGRLSALLLPFRERPLHVEDLELSLPFGQNPTALDGWSSFPSDHAVLYFFLAAAVFLISRKIGALLFLHALLCISMSRVYAGLHYPSDIAAGAVIGIVLALALVRPIACRVVPKLHLLRWEARHPQTFYPLMFFISFQMASMFNSLRAFLSVVKFLGA